MKIHKKLSTNIKHKGLQKLKNKAASIRQEGQRQ